MGTTPDRESQIDALFAGVRAERLAGVVWFDEAQHAGLYHQDWRLEDDPAALAAFTAAVVTPGRVSLASRPRERGPDRPLITGRMAVQSGLWARPCWLARDPSWK